MYVPITVNKCTLIKSTVYLHIEDRFLVGNINLVSCLHRLFLIIYFTENANVYQFDNV